MSDERLTEEELEAVAQAVREELEGEPGARPPTRAAMRAWVTGRLLSEVRASRACSAVPRSGEILQRLYDSRIGGGVAWMGRSGWEWSLVVGEQDRRGNAATFDEAARALAATALPAFPDSEFARWWRLRAGPRADE